MATQATQRKAYAARSQASNVLDGNQQPDIQRPGKRLQQQAVSNIFSTEGDPEAKQYERSAPAPAPFLTDENAVNTHGRLGGYVQQSDSLISVEGEDEFIEEGRHAANANATSERDAANAENEVKYNENQNIAKGHKKRNLASNIFDPDQAPAESNKPAYDRKNMSNIF